VKLKNLRKKIRRLEKRFQEGLKKIGRLEKRFQEGLKKLAKIRRKLQAAQRSPADIIERRLKLSFSPRRFPAFGFTG
jgi:chromosome segregation ATPase